ncbi:MAG TPA: PAS domain S-box protein [Gaiellaceae bacterium]|nr:PAS domain S-box protein [Gaiellaceae bacterium]
MSTVYATQGTDAPRRVFEAPDREAFEAALAAGRAKLQSLYRMAPIGIGRNVNRVIQEVNPAFCQMVGYSADELVGMPTTALYLSEADYEAVGKAIYATSDRGGTGTAACQFRRKDGAAIDVLVTVTAIDPQNLAAGSVWAVMDVTDLKRAQEAQRESDERFRRLAENAPDVIFRYRLRPEPAVEYVNAVVTEISGGYTPDDLYADAALFWRLVHPDDTAKLVEALQSGRPSSVVARWRRKDGSWIWSEVRSVPVFDDDGELLAYEGILRDVTEHAEAIEERKRNFELLRRAGEERGRLLNRLVHAQEEERRLIAQDLHDDSIQVLTALAMRLELLTDTLEDPSTVSEVTEAACTTRSVISGLRGLLFELDPPVLRREGLAAALAEQLDLIRRQTGAEVRLESRMTTEPPFETTAIAYRIAQEALVNARKHAGATLLTVHVDGDEEGLRVCVADDGCGFEMKPEQLGHLGLVSMRERAETAAGWWQVDSAPGSGTMVEFFLPLRPGGAALAGHAA